MDKEDELCMVGKMCKITQVINIGETKRGYKNLKKLWNSETETKNNINSLIHGV